MKQRAKHGVLRATRSVRGFARKTSLAFTGLVYTALMLSGFPVAMYEFSQGNFFVGSRVLGILGLVLGVSATLARLDAMEYNSPTFSEEDGEGAMATENTIEEGSVRERFYSEYVLEDRFMRVMYGLYIGAAVFLAISFIPML